MWTNDGIVVRIPAGSGATPPDVDAPAAHAPRRSRAW